MKREYFRVEPEHLPDGQGYIEVVEGWVSSLLEIGTKGELISTITDVSLLPRASKSCEIKEEFLEVVSRAEFEGKWLQAKLVTSSLWATRKDAHPLGVRVQGAVRRFTHAGVVVELGNAFFGLLNHEETLQASPKKAWPMGHRVEARVQGYDEDNQRFLLTSPVFDPEPLPYRFENEMPTSLSARVAFSSFRSRKI